jgi:hypothetical protein
MTTASSPRGALMRWWIWCVAPWAIPAPAPAPLTQPYRGLTVAGHGVAAQEFAVQVRVTVPFSTRFGLDDQPGELAGYGTITADQARELAAEGTRRRILTDPATGGPIDYGTTVYRPPAALRDLVLTRTPICGFPSCLQPARRGDLDHRERPNPTEGTGPTSEHNLDPYRRRHHRAKHTEGWSVHRDDHGTFTWTSPTGHTWTHQPEPIAEPVPKRPPTDLNEPAPF